MGATWAFILAWFPAKWDVQAWREASGVQRPLWLEGCTPPYTISVKDRAAVASVVEKVNAEKTITAGRAVWSDAPDQVKSSVNGYVRAVTGRPAWNIATIVMEVLASENCTPLGWAQQKDVRSCVSGRRIH